MRSARFSIVAFLIGTFTGVLDSPAAPLSLHPENPHYFLSRGKPTVLITSAEHYGAVLNLDFDCVPYLDELKSKNLNLTRTFTGAYVEPQGAFNITQNTLAPAPGRFIAPWVRSATPGYANGGNKFDLTKWDEAYFKRLKDFVAQAEKRGVIVELNLFCPFYEERQWQLSPQNAANNINGIGAVVRTNVYSLDKHGGLLAVQEAMVRKIVTELNRFDNLYYEICNEPYFGGVTMEWQHHIANVIVETEKRLRKKHLISQNIANGSMRIQNPHPAISIFNFHYASPPAAVALNQSLNKVIGDNETGFRGTNDLPYRVEAWEFILAGGGLFNHLDYSFTAEHENGTFVYPATQPGGGSTAFREQLRILVDFINGFEFVKMKTDNSLLKSGIPVGYTARALAEPGRAYAIYLAPTPAPKDEFSVRWSGKIEPKFSETYTLHTVSNDGVRVRVNNQTVIDNWTGHSDQEDAGTVALTAGQKYDIQADYFQSGGNATMRLSWSSASQPKGIVPANALTPITGAGPGLTGRYYLGTNFNSLRMTRTDATIDFNWSQRSPFANPARDSLASQTANFVLALPPGRYQAEWVNTKSGAVDKRESFEHASGTRTMTSPPFDEDAALRIKATKKVR